MEHFNIIIQEIADRYGITPQTVVSEIENAIHTTIDTTMAEGKDAQREIWHSISSTYPSAEELIEWIVKRMILTMN